MAKIWYLINNLEDFVNSSRRLVFHCFGDTNQPLKPSDNLDTVFNKMTKEELDEMNSSLPYSESLLIVKQFAKHKIDKKGNETYQITDDILQSIIEALNSRMVSNILNHLVNNGILESAYDSELGDFIFWVNDEENNDQTQKPETD